MKKILLFITFTLLFTLFSCTPDEYETQPKKKIEKTINPTQADNPNPDGPGDAPTPPGKPKV
jgi:hypothetical protein